MTLRPPAGHSARAGTLLIIVAGLSALLASLAIAFLVRQRSSGEEIALFTQEVQARIMLVAACDYVLEGSRIGYDTATDPNHLEAFGWIDVRDGSIGPNTRGVKSTDVVPLFNPALVEDSDGDGAADRPAWPAVGAVARCPMYVMERPPYAVQLTAAYNPISVNPSDPTFGHPYQSHRDPEPVATTRADFFLSKPEPRANSLNLSWFRVYRDGPATFVVTCGAGGTQGFRDWNEVKGAGATARMIFGNDPAMFANLYEHEIRFWYRIEWSAAVATSEVHNIKNAWDIGPEDHYVSYAMNVSDSTVNPRTQSMCKNMGGTIRWIERLLHTPSKW